MLKLLFNFYSHYKKEVDNQLRTIREFAQSIEDETLKLQAVQSILDKTFHCYGASFYAEDVPAKKQKAYLKFCTSYQTLCDYLDNLVDQTNESNEQNFRQLHRSLHHVFEPQSCEYYHYQTHQNDSGYIKMLIKNCREVLKLVNFTEAECSHLKLMVTLYSELQIYKHLNVHTREHKLRQFAKAYEDCYPDLEWFEFCAASGSTLSIFNVIAQALSEKDLGNQESNYFPGIQLQHIMLDYLIDLEDDEKTNEFNFFAQYETNQTGSLKLLKQYQSNRKAVSGLHVSIVDGLMALYLAEGILQNKNNSIEKDMFRKLPFKAKWLFLNAYGVMWSYRNKKTPIHGV